MTKPLRPLAKAFRLADRQLRKAARSYTYCLSNFKAGTHGVSDYDSVEKYNDELADAAVNFAFAAAEFSEQVTIERKGKQ